jgi:pilus assembly protein Flp/PilA
LLPKGIIDVYEPLHDGVFTNGSFLSSAATYAFPSVMTQTLCVIRCNRASGCSALHVRQGDHSPEIERTTMKNFATFVKQFLVSEDGPTAVEYAVMLALIIVVCLTAIQAVGTNANNKFNQVQNALT